MPNPLIDQAVERFKNKYCSFELVEVVKKLDHDRLEAFLRTELEALEKAVREEAYLEEKTESREKGIIFALKAVNMHLRGYGCRFEYPCKNHDITFYDDVDELGNEMDLTKAFSKKITREMSKSLTPTKEDTNAE